MYHDFFGWVRLILLIFLILLFSMFCIGAETRIQMEQPEPKEPEQKEQTYIAQAIPTSTNPTEAEAATEPTFNNPIEETTPPTEAPTIATEPPTEPETEPTYTAEELEMLALVIYQEAGADWCSDETRLMVGTVVMNRVADPRFPDTMYDVLTQESQYGRLHWTGLVWPKRASSAGEAHAVERAYTIAEQILLGERTLPADVIFQSEHIMGEIVAAADGFYFCR